MVWRQISGLLSAGALLTLVGCATLPGSAEPGLTPGGLYRPQAGTGNNLRLPLRDLNADGPNRGLEFHTTTAQTTLPPAVGNYVVEPEPAKGSKPWGKGPLFGSSRAPAARPAAGQGTVVPMGDIDRKSADEGFQWSDLSPKELYANAKDAVGLGPDEAQARALYQEADALYRQQQYADAAAKFKAAAGRWPDSTLEEDALFYCGEAYFFAQHYSKATDVFGELIKKYDYTRHLDVVSRRMFEIGRYWEQFDESQPSMPVTPNLTDDKRPLFDTFGHAIKAYDSIRLTDPTGPLADDSVMATAGAYFRKNRYEEAAYHYDLIRNEYPKSEHQVNAHLLAMKSRELLYQGPAYDSQPLEEAGKIAGQALTQFPTQLGSERGAVIETKNRVLEEQARRDLIVAQYYEKKRYFGAARYYYQAILKEYPETTVAGWARTRLEEIKDFPAEPPNHFKWLTDLFDKWK